MSTEKHTEGILQGIDARRFRACWNAMDGLTTEQVEALGAGGVKELAEALSAALSVLEEHAASAVVGVVIDEARAVLARLEGKG